MNSILDTYKEMQVAIQIPIGQVLRCKEFQILLGQHLKSLRDDKADLDPYAEKFQLKSQKLHHAIEQTINLLELVNYKG